LHFTAPARPFRKDVRTRETKFARVFLKSFRSGGSMTLRLRFSGTANGIIPE
jgi:hypothetical protein